MLFEILLKNLMCNFSLCFDVSFTILQLIEGTGIAKVIDSGHSNFKKGDLVQGMTRWEEYSIIKSPESIFKIEDTEVPLSYYTGILGMLSV